MHHSMTKCCFHMSLRNQMIISLVSSCRMGWGGGGAAVAFWLLVFDKTKLERKLWMRYSCMKLWTLFVSSQSLPCSKCKDLKDCIIRCLKTVVCENPGRSAFSAIFKPACLVPKTCHRDQTASPFWCLMRIVIETLDLYIFMVLCIALLLNDRMIR